MTVAKYEASEFAIFSRSPERIGKIIDANLGENGKLSLSNFDRVGIPAGGSLSWTVPGLAGEESVRELVGIVLFWKPARAFWRADYTGKSTAPDCRSDDGITGIGDPGGSCDVCQYAEWGSDPKGGRGQWCKGMKQLFVLRPNSIMPTIITMPPTSLTIIDKFFYRLMASTLSYYEVVTRFKLERVDNGLVPAFSRLVLEHVSELTDEQISVIESLRDKLVPVFKTVRTLQVGEPDSE